MSEPNPSVRIQISWTTNGNVPGISSHHSFTERNFYINCFIYFKVDVNLFLH